MPFKQYFYYFCFLIFTFLNAQNDQSAPPVDNSGFRNFITAKGDRLYDGNKEFRFISFNIPNLLTIEDNLPFKEKNYWRLPDQFEIDDALKSIVQLGGQVVRTYVVTVKRDNDPPGTIKYVEAPGKFNEEAFKTFDRVLASANHNGILLIIPFIDNWKWMGGRPQYAAFRNKDRGVFYTDEQLKSDYKATVGYILNRVNSITGTAYKDDKAILAWELGNEIWDAPINWVNEMAKYIKSIDKNHLVSDGRQYRLVHEEILESPYIDILSTHHYEPDPYDMLNHIHETAAKAKGKKPYYVGEFGFISTTGLANVLDMVIHDENIAGALIWSLRFHNRSGGFYWHSEPMGGGLYKAYHWPGFQSGNLYDEINMFHMYRQKAFMIQGKPIPEIPALEPPGLLPINDLAKISWQGSAGAQSYDIQRSESGTGNWQTIGRDLSDAHIAYGPLFNDTSAEIGKSYFYRVIAINYAGVSEPSNEVGPVEAKELKLVDNMANFAILYSKSKDVNLETGSTRAYKEDFHRLQGRDSSYITYFVPGNIKSFELFTFSDKGKSNLDISASANGKDFKPVIINEENLDIGKLDYDYVPPILVQGNLGVASANYLKIEFSDKAQIGRVEISYGK